MLPASGEDIPQERTATTIPSVQRKLDRLEDQLGLTQGGRDWFETAMDPFHDEALVLGGYPDHAADATITQCVKRSIRISAPASVVNPGDTWDCNIFLTRDTLGGPYHSAPAVINGGDFARNDQTLHAGGNTMIVKAKSDNAIPGGTRLWPSLIPTATVPTCEWTDGVEIQQISPVNIVEDATPLAGTSLDSSFLDGSARVIGGAWELKNRTRILDIGGTIAPYRQVSAPSLAVGQQREGTTLASQSPVCNVVRSKAPPATLADAMLLPDTKEWHSSKGAYVVHTLEGVEQPLQQAMSKFLLLAEDGTTPGSTDPATQPGVDEGSSAGLATIQKSGFGSANGTRPASNKTEAHFNQSGIFCSGLSAATVLILNCRWIIERAPTLAEPDLVVLAQPSTPFDPVAMRLYTEAINRIPPGVHLDENHLGTWFKDAVDKVIQASKPIVEHSLPIADLIAPALGPKMLLGNEIIQTAAGRRRRGRGTAAKAKKGGRRGRAKRVQTPIERRNNALRPARRR